MIPAKFITQTIFPNGEIHMDLLRLDLLHPEISGNKWFKLKLNLEEAKRQGKETILTFGGAYSNHIAATAAAASYAGFKSIGIIRGEYSNVENHTLSKAFTQGMTLKFISREEYRNKHKIEWLKNLREEFGDFYLIPEGGSNKFGVLGCKEIIQNFPQYDYVLCACGTGTTFTGMVLGKQINQILIGINILKGENRLLQDVQSMINGITDMSVNLVGNEGLEKETIENSIITNRFAFSGYAAYDQELIDFKKFFEESYNIPLDYIYTTKLLFAAWQLTERKKFKRRSTVLVIHSGGLQGNQGFELRYRSKLIR